MQIKANAVRHLTDARYFAAQGVDWLGFCLDLGSPDYLQPQTAQTIRGWLSGPKFIGEFSAMQSPQEIAACVELLNLDAVQIAKFIDVQGVRLAVSVPVFVHAVINSREELDELQALTAFSDGFVLRLGKDWQDWKSVLEDFGDGRRIWLDTAADVFELAELPTSVECLCVQGGEEERPGYKSFDDLDAWFEALEPLRSV